MFRWLLGDRMKGSVGGVKKGGMKFMGGGAVINVSMAAW
jgi:hypothetical protein